MDKAFKLLALTTALVSLAGCVTQKYENSQTPVVQNESSNTEIAMTRISLGLGYLKMGNTTQAKLNLEKAKRFSPNLVQVYTAFAHYYETVGEDELTISSYEKALSLKPDDADTLNNYGVFLCRKDRLVEAEQQFLKAIAVPTYLLVSKSYENLALCQLKALDFEKAQVYLNKAVDHSPANASILYQMMRLQYAKGQYHQALAYAKRYEKATRRFTPESLSLSYKIYTSLGNQRIAKNYGTMLVKMFPESWHAQQYLLNELERIDADELAEQYTLLSVNQISANQLSANQTTVERKADNQLPAATLAKKVRVLKPNNKPPIAIKRSKASTRPSQTAQALSQTILSSPARSFADRQSVESTADKPAKPKKTIVLTAPKSPENSTSKPVVKLSPARPSPIATDANEPETSTSAVTEKLAVDEASAQDLELSATAAVINDSNQIVEQGVASLASEDSSISENNLTSEETLAEMTAESSGISEPQAPVYLTLADLPQHKVAKGENLFTISKHYNIYLRTLRQWNKLDETALLKVGDTVYLADPASVQAEQEQ
ncbi:type IV pilus biogenesis/stability protein PilW [Thalassotalea euphylliae]|uniref:Type IV pilus biogenesis/stability protein PilW n=1 Tax=Thalassotalea euphylliae TaxID=1655234 RepID=A0A3E0TMN2_9GAMM|nr:type IV pilus biogenesis/stability protein PilW [Thalassotalea euphylliae]REL25829.1 type IV pilus biogenesis/stability protein PilW [Thalassotalea euphylliae]